MRNTTTSTVGIRDAIAHWTKQPESPAACERVIAAIGEFGKTSFALDEIYPEVQYALRLPQIGLFMLRSRFNLPKYAHIFYQRRVLNKLLGAL